MIPAFARIHVPETVRWGIGLAFVTALVSGVSIYVNGIAVKQLPDAAVFTTLKNGLAALVLLGLAATSVRPSEIRGLPRGSRARLVAIGIVGGSLPFLLFFAGLAMASAPSAAFIHKTLFVWVALLAVPFLGERLGRLQLAALTVLFGGQALLLSPAGLSWGLGETMIAAATVLWAIETIVAKRVLRDVPSSVVGAARLGIGLLVLAAFLVLSGKLGAIAALGAEQWRWVLLTGLLLSAYVAAWYAALQRAPASAVTAILVLGAPVTATIQVVASGSLPLAPAFAGHVFLLGAGTVIAVLTVRRSSPRPASA